ncbi:glycosyltransferase [Clostridium tyrobutyricum]|uniref:glycosyltransferase n=1 Tax=Clostridium tyrobutyricum TaxID=1519 RepID=UPI001C38C22F|nr:glycosyltransferase [Clostridium tyrobutyricum]MBV4417556.1 glycosyltransferase [Clostridium tyrobutyricum]MBV4417563.1 glycosyltransferase [Clostridium tyrobutyricum]
MHRKLKICYICEATGGGVRKNLLDLLFNIDRKKFDIYLIYSSIRADDIFIDNLYNLDTIGVKLYKIDLVRSINILKNLKPFLKMKSIISDIKPDIVHCHSSIAGMYGRIAAFLNKVDNVIYTPHAYIMQNPEIGFLKNKVFNIIEKLLEKITTKTINVSKGEKDFAINNRIGNLNKFVVVYNGINESHYTRNYIETKKLNLGFLKDDFIIGTTVRMEKQKDPFTFVNIALNLIKKYDNVKFVYIGDGELYNKVNELIKKNNVKDKIKLLGFRKDASDLVSIFDIYMITSLYEGMPYSLIEAISQSKPILASDVIGNNEVVKNDFNGLLFEKKNIKQAVSFLDDMINDSNKLNMYANNSFKLFKEKFMLNSMLKNTEKVYLSNY